MPKFIVTVERTVTLTTDIEVEAPNADAARGAARQHLIQNATEYAALSKWEQCWTEDDEILREGEEELNRTLILYDAVSSPASPRI